MANRKMLQDLWDSEPSSEWIFNPEMLSGLPDPVQRYLTHAIAAGTRLASAVLLRMHGEIKLKGWYRFSAEEVIRWNRGMIWNAAVRMYGISLRGGDRFLNGNGAMRWKLFSIIPLINAFGPDITRSAAGRVNIESIWLPSVLCSDEVTWTAPDESRLHARFHAHGETAGIDYTIDPNGGLKSVSMPRWGNPEGAEFHYADCGAWVESEHTFGGYTIPSRLRVGWHFGSERFESDGEFFRVTIDEAMYR
jgi:hypothetical protein